jgi:hypothetical protein
VSNRDGSETAVAGLFGPVCIVIDIFNLLAFEMVTSGNGRGSGMSELAPSVDIRYLLDGVVDRAAIDARLVEPLETMQFAQRDLSLVIGCGRGCPMPENSPQTHDRVAGSSRLRRRCQAKGASRDALRHQAFWRSNAIGEIKQAGHAPSPVE